VPLNIELLSLTTSFFALHSLIHPREITEFVYRYSSSERAHVILSFKLESLAREQEVAALLSAMRREGMVGHDISGNEMAKTHGKYMVGGSMIVPHERLFQFGMFMVTNTHLIILIPANVHAVEFPERPGALRKFLSGLQKGWNISLFHYRNHGAGKHFMRLSLVVSAELCCRSGKGIDWHTSATRGLRRIPTIPGRLGISLR